MPFLNKAIYFPVIIFSCFACFTWGFIADEWEILGDGVHYIKLYNGEIADGPFGYRILAPALARLLPWDATKSFTFIC